MILRLLSIIITTFHNRLTNELFYHYSSAYLLIDKIPIMVIAMKLFTIFNIIIL